MSLGLYIIVIFAIEHIKYVKDWLVVAKFCVQVLQKIIFTLLFEYGTDKVLKTFTHTYTYIIEVFSIVHMLLSYTSITKFNLFWKMVTDSYSFLVVVLFSTVTNLGTGPVFLFCKEWAYFCCPKKTRMDRFFQLVINVVPFFVTQIFCLLFCNCLFS